ncbi:hypothetical protein SLS62_006234 [Diatrype stigma]|uniref:Uncharacterized protein n=1 Tax=Diatrype stigma TaxID=117547 RepID=A0AAN9UMT6_9PEZI
MDVVSNSIQDLPGSASTFSDTWVLMASTMTNGDSALDMITISPIDLEPSSEAQSLAGIEVPALGSTFSNEDPLGTEGGLGQSFAHEEGLRFKNELAEIEGSWNGNTHDLATPEKSGIEPSIDQLSRLSTRLSQLLNCSAYFLANDSEVASQSQNQDSTLHLRRSIEAVFKSTNAWLIQGSLGATAISNCSEWGSTSAVDLLHHVFSASSYLVEILRYVRNGETTTASSSSLMSLSHPSRTGSIVSRSRVESATTDESQHSSLVVHHLELVCLSLLSNIYVKILVAFRRSAGALASSASAARGGNHATIGSSEHVDTTLRVHLQLVSIVHLCSYFIRRQEQALEMVTNCSYTAIHLLTNYFGFYYYRAVNVYAHSATDSRDAKKAPFSWALGKEGMTYYEVIKEDPTLSDVCHKGMVMIETVQSIDGIFPSSSMKAAAAAEPHRAFVVDVGGGLGNALISIMKECGGGSYGTKLVLQGLAEVLDGKDPVRVDGVDNMPYNLFDPQPVKGRFATAASKVLSTGVTDACLCTYGRSRVFSPQCVAQPLRRGGPKDPE